MAHLEYIRDKLAPYQLNYLRRIEVLLKTYSDRSMDNKQEAQEDLFSIQNSRKARLGGMGGLQDPVLMGKKAKEEADLREAVAKDPKLKDYETAWAEVESTLKYAREHFTEYNLFERGQAFHSDLFGKARTLVRAGDERAKKDGDRLREYRESGLKSLEMALFSEAPIHDNLEIAQLADSLGMMIEMAGVDHPLVKKIMEGKSPVQRATELVRGTKLMQSSERKKLYEGGKDAIAASGDPMIALAKLVDDEARKVRKVMEEKVEEPQRQAYGKIAKARFAVQGTGVYPDATFTLRLAFGPVKGYEENGKQVPAFTNLGGAFERSKAQGNVDPFMLPDSWHKAKDKMKLDTPFNFVSTADIIGGNSGSPVVDRKGEFVGIIFDGNIQSLVLDYAYSDVIARAVSVDCRGILESLKSVYGTTDLVNELLKK
jgi:hypothetical protein